MVKSVHLQQELRKNKQFQRMEGKYAVTGVVVHHMVLTKPRKEITQFIIRKGVCLKCLTHGHMSEGNKCESVTTCAKCNQPHLTCLHMDKKNNTGDAERNRELYEQGHGAVLKHRNREGPGARTTSRKREKQSYGCERDDSPETEQRKSFKLCQTHFRFMAGISYTSYNGNIQRGKGSFIVCISRWKH